MVFRPNACQPSGTSLGSSRWKSRDGEIKSPHPRASPRCGALPLVEAGREKEETMKCIRCSEEAQPGKTTCATCARQKRMYAAERKTLLVRRGLCPICGKEPPQPGKRTCQACLKNIRTRKTIGPETAELMLWNVISRMVNSGFSDEKILAICGRLVAKKTLQ